MENGQQSVYITGNTKSEIELRVLGESCEFEIKVYISNLDNNANSIDKCDSCACNRYDCL